MAAARARIGTSGWVYDHWWGEFYPEDLPQKERLAYYSASFGTVEVNNTFYRLPSETALRAWLHVVPPDFSFAFKAHRYITHRKRLLDAEDSVRLFLERLAPIAERTGVVLFQAPPFLPFDPERLDAFLGLLPDDAPYGFAFEFRHPSWNNEQTWEILSLHDVAFCVHDFEQEPPLQVTTDAVYLRFHGPAGPYRGLYGRERLAPWAERVRGWLAEGRDVWAYFNNDERAHATRDAAELRALVEAHAGRRERGAAHA